MHLKTADLYKSEDEIQKECLRYLKKLGIKHTVTDASGRRKSNRNQVTKSWPDITCLIHPIGVMWVIECKTPKGGFKPGQKEMLQDLENRGAMVTIARDVMDVKRDYAWIRNNLHALLAMSVG